MLSNLNKKKRIKAIYTIRKHSTLHLGIKSKRASTKSYTVFSSFVFNKNLVLILEKQLSWAVKASFHFAKK